MGKVSHESSGSCPGTAPSVLVPARRWGAPFPATRCMFMTATGDAGGEASIRPQGNEDEWSAEGGRTRRLQRIITQGPDITPLKIHKKLKNYMRNIFLKIWIFCASVIVMLMAAVLILVVHIAKVIRKYGYERNPFCRSHRPS